MKRQNTKENREKLLKTIFNVSYQNLQLLPYFCRLASVISKVYPEFSKELLDLLSLEFNELSEQKDELKAEQRVKNIRMLCESCKFGLCQNNLIIECLRTCISQFETVPSSIECISHILECSGRFLLNSPESKETVEKLLDKVFELKQEKEVNNRIIANLEHAYKLVRPSAIMRKHEKRLKPV